MDFIGSVVSLGCGDVLGTYQGKVAMIDQEAQTVTIEKAFRNGIQCTVPQVTINAADIHELKILKTSQEASLMPEVRHQHISVTANSTSTVPTKPAPLNQQAHAAVMSQTGTGSTMSAHGTSKHNRQKGSGSPANMENNKTQRYSPLTSRSPVKGMHQEVSGQNTHSSVGNQLTRNNNRHNYDNTRQHQRTSPVKPEEVGHGTGRQRKDSYSDGQTVSVPNKRGYLTPRKADMRKKTQREDCFSTPVDAFISEDFDFEKNLALFDKQAVFEEIESLGYPKILRNTNPQEAKYKNEENVLPTKPTVFERIIVPGGPGKHFVTDTGLVVPSVSYDMRNKLLGTAQECGYKLERQIEAVGRSATEMVLQLIGGNHRLTPQNVHQQPSVVILCGPHIQGAEGVNCARHLAAHNIQVTLFMPNFVKVLQELEDELNLFDLCDGIKTASIKDLPDSPVDIIVNAMDNHDNKCLREQSCYQKVVEWANDNKAPVLGIDPPVEGSAINMKWSLSVVLPLALSNECGQVYLADLSLPKKIFESVGIQYMSPFAHKFVIPLYNS